MKDWTQIYKVINNIYKEGELQESATVKDFLTVQHDWTKLPNIHTVFIRGIALKKANVILAQTEKTSFKVFRNRKILYICTVITNNLFDMELVGIEYTKDVTGRNRYVRIDLEKYGKNQLLEDFLDGLEIMARKDEETVSLDEFNRYIDERLNANV